VISRRLSTYLPPHALWPNARPHWATKAKEVKAYRSMAKIKCLTSMEMRRRPPRLEYATVQVTFYFKDARRRDPDNALAAMKSAFDGMVDSGLLADDNKLSHLPVIMKVDRQFPRVEIEVTGEVR